MFILLFSLLINLAVVCTFAAMPTKSVLTLETAGDALAKTLGDSGK